MKVGDILDRKAVERLPAGSIVIHDEGKFYNVVVRREDGYDWVSNDALGHARQKKIHADDWTLVHLSGPIVPRVGEAVETAEQAAALPVGSVVVDTGDDVVFRAPAVKVGDNRWMWESEENGVSYGADSDVCGDVTDIVIYIPERADTGSGRSAA